MKSALSIHPAVTEADLEAVRTLFREYADWLKVDLCFQGFAQELAGLPGLYAPPRGRLLLAFDGEALAGCVALRPLAENICEMKRLYVRALFRQKGLGRQLVQQLIAEARGLGYERMRLDTLAHMTPAIELYESLGFQRIASYYPTPLPDTVFMELEL